MSRHIIRTLIDMLEIRCIFWNVLIEKALKILSDSRISIFIDCQACRSMLDKYLTPAGLNAAFVYNRFYIPGNKVKSSFESRECYFLLKNHLYISIRSKAPISGLASRTLPLISSGIPNGSPLSMAKLSESNS